MPIIDITLSPGRSPERLGTLARLVAEVTSAALEIPQEKVRIMMREVPDTHWSTGGVTIAQEKAERGAVVGSAAQAVPATDAVPGHEAK
ncbi:tautomerase family protein [Ornithinimicrobium cavernae]|uniref:tautomerase family protein n=1 Tax=Ornithinimicrobium cavernae TaxID=2666047 RepID=UPI000D6913B1|nr:tautomerase family protein [Ornithinimicrobium cavernae]